LALIFLIISIIRTTIRTFIIISIAPDGNTVSLVVGAFERPILIVAIAGAVHAVFFVVAIDSFGLCDDVDQLVLGFTTIFGLVLVVVAIVIDIPIDGGSEGVGLPVACVGAAIIRAVASALAAVITPPAVVIIFTAAFVDGSQGAFVIIVLFAVVCSSAAIACSVAAHVSDAGVVATIVILLGLAVPAASVVKAVFTIGGSALNPSADEGIFWADAGFATGFVAFLKVMALGRIIRVANDPLVRGSFLSLPSSIGCCQNGSSSKCESHL